MSGEPTLGEIMRRLDDTTRILADLAAQLREDRASNAATFVRQDVWHEARRADQSLIREVEKDIQEAKDEKSKNQNFRRQVSLGAALGVLGILGSFGIAIFSLLAGGG